TIISIPGKKINQLIEEGGKKADALNFLENNFNEVLMTIIIGNNFSKILAAAIATLMAQRQFDHLAISIAVGVSTIALSLVAEFFPKALGRKFDDILIYPVSKTLRKFYYAFYPITKISIFVIQK